MRSWRIVTALLLCLVLVGLTACNFLGSSDQEEVSQQLVEVVRGDVTISINGSGTIEVVNEADLSFSINGKIDEIYVKENDGVSESEVLARLDTAALELAVTQARATLVQAQATLEQAKATLEQAFYDLDILERRHVSYEQQRILKLQINAVELQIKAAVTQVDAAEQTLEEALKQIDEAIIIAPFDGVVASVDADEGDTVSTVTTIFHLVDPSSMELNAEVDEIDIPDVKPRQRAIIEVDALPELQLEGWVTSIGLLPRVESGLVLYEVKIGFDVPKGAGLKIGMSATADIIIRQRSNVLLVPNRAITQDSQSNSVVKVMVGEQTEERPVVIGISDGLQTEIVSGLNEGETVVIETRAKTTTPGFF